MPGSAFYLVDVFTDQQFGGNQLAVFTDASGISSEQMQRIAREFNFSEVTFVLPPENPGNDYKVRIFTPGRELPMAGHPTIGTAYVLARTGMIAAGRDSVIFEEGVGAIKVGLEWNGGAPAMIWMQQPMPTFGEALAERDTIAALLSLTLDDLSPTLPVQVVSCGVPFLYVPVRSLAAIQKIKLRQDLWEQVESRLHIPELFVFTPEVTTPTGTVHSRMFAPSMGIAEDPATGAASGPLGCYLVQHGVVSGNPAVILSEQGFEMGRPSYIHIVIERTGELFTRVSVGGTCVYMGEGTMQM